MAPAAVVIGFPGHAGADTEESYGTGTADPGWGQYLEFFQCDNNGRPSCPSYDDVAPVGMVSWQEWKTAGTGVYYYLLTQDFWGGNLPNEPGVTGEAGPDDPQVSTYNATHWDGGTEIADDVGNGTCWILANPPYYPCDESNYNGAGHHFVNQTIVYDNIYYYSLYGYPAYQDGLVELASFNNIP